MNVSMTMGFHLNVIWIALVEGDVCIIIRKGRHALSLLNDCYLIPVHAIVIVFEQEVHRLFVRVSTSHDTKGNFFSWLGVARLEGDDCFYVELNVRSSGGKLSG